MGKGKSKSRSQSGKLRASHILVEKHKKLLEIQEKLNNGAHFRELARNYSTCSSKKKGGDLGWFSKGMMVQEFENAVKSMKVGEVSDPVKTKFGWHLIKRTG